MPDAPKLSVLVLMGVSGCGKSTIGALLASRLGWAFVEGDALHPPANIAKMADGRALDDNDRTPWLDAIARTIDAWRSAGRAGIITCSALKRRYRDFIIGGRREVGLIYLKGDKALLRERLAARQGHFMPASLLDSQLEALEEPRADERPILIDIRKTPEMQVDDIIDAVGGGAK